MSRFPQPRVGFLGNLRISSQRSPRTGEGQAGGARQTPQVNAELVQAAASAPAAPDAVVEGSTFSEPLGIESAPHGPVPLAFAGPTLPAASTNAREQTDPLRIPVLEVLLER